MKSYPKPLICGNWKMNGLKSDIAHISTIETNLHPSIVENVDIGICPPATLLAAMCEAANKILIGAQNCHISPNGAYTGDISVGMISDTGARMVICGHSERRADHAETDHDVRSKAESVIQGGLCPIICIGETHAERQAGTTLDQAGTTLDIVGSQLAQSVPDLVPDDLIIAYEPVWAIGTGLTPSLDDVAQVHGFIRKTLLARFGERAHNFRLLYGGSVKPDNAADLMAVENVNGALVGGASLKPDDFLGILSVCANV